MSLTPVSFLGLRTSDPSTNGVSSTFVNMTSWIEALSEVMSYVRGVLSVSFIFGSGEEEAAFLERWLRALPGVLIAPLPKTTPVSGAVMIKEVRKQNLDGPRLFSAFVGLDKMPASGIFTRPFEWRFSDMTYRGVLRLQRQKTGYLLTFELNFTKGIEDEIRGLQVLYPSASDLDALRYAWAYALSSASRAPVAAITSGLGKEDGYYSGLLPHHELALIASVRRKGRLTLPGADSAGGFFAGSKPSLAVLRGVACRSGFSLSVLVDKVCERAGIAFPDHLPIPRATVDAMAAEKEIDPSVLYYRINRVTLPGVDPSWTAYHGVELYVESPAAMAAILVLGNGQTPCDETDMRARLLKAWLDPCNPKADNEVERFARETLCPFLLGRSLPNIRTIRKAALLGKVSVAEVEGHIIDSRYPDLRKHLKKWGKEGVVFHINPKVDGKLLAKYLGHPNRLGFVLWLHRKCLGIDPVTMARRCHFAFETYAALEHDASPYGLKTPDAYKLAEVIGVPFDKLLGLAERTYKRPARTAEVSRKEGPHAAWREKWESAPGSLKEMIVRAMEGATLAQASKRMNQSFLETAGLEGGMTSSLFEQMMRIPIDDVSDYHLASFILAYRDAIDPERFWSTARPSVKALVQNGKLTVPVGTTLNDVLGFSLAEAFFSARLRFRLSSAEMARRAGYSTHKMIIWRESAEAVSTPAARIGHLSEILEVDPRLLTLVNSPWALLAFPLQDDEGNLLSHPDDPELPYRIAQKGRGRSERHSHLRRLTAEIEGISPLVRKKLMTIYDVLQDDELLSLAPRLAKDDRLNLVEAFCQAELHYFLGRDGEGEINWNLPEGWTAEAVEALDPVTIAKQIEPKNGWWSVQLGYSKSRTQSVAEAIDKGLSPEQIARFVTVAHAHGFSNIPRKVFYLRFRGEFLANLVDWKSGITERPEISRRLDGIGLRRTLEKRGHGPVRVTRHETLRRLNVHERRQLLAHSTGHDRHAVERFLSEAHGRYFPAANAGMSAAMTETISAVAGG